MTRHSLLHISLSCLLAAAAIAAEPDPRRPPAIEAEEVPVVPDEIFDQLSRYQSVRAAGFAGFSPQGDGILIRTRFGNTVQLHRVYEPGGRREQITFFEEPVRGSFLPEAEDGAILLSMSEGGDENYQIYLLDQQEHRAKLLTDGESRNRIGAVRNDGGAIVIGSNRRNGRDTDLYLADPRQPGSMELIFPTDREYWFAADWSHDGGALLLQQYVSINESYFALFDLDSKTKTDLPLPTDARAAIGDLAFAKDDESIYIVTDAGSEFRRLARFDIGAKKYQWLTDDIAWDVEDVEVDPETGKVVLVVNWDGASRLYLLENDQPRELKTPLGIISSLEFSPDGRRLGFTLSRPDAPSDAYTFSLENEELARWTYSETGGLDASKFVLPRQIKFPSFDGREIPAYYFRPHGEPAADAGFPVIINIHGGPESQWRPYFSGTTQYMVNELGAAVIAPNVRGSEGYGKTYLRLDNDVKREDSVKDIGALLDWIAEQPELDASRVAVTGGSYGGYMVLSSLVHYGDRIKAGVDIVGIANFITFLENTAAYRRDLRRAEYGDEREPKIREFFERINPTSQADKIRSALLVAHGVNDPRVPFSEARQIADKVRSQGRAVWTVYASNEGHGFGKKDNRDYLLAVEMLFLKRHLELDR